MAAPGNGGLIPLIVGRIVGCIPSTAKRASWSLVDEKSWSLFGVFSP